MPDFVLPHRVYYNETDQMGRVYHSNFAIWMEQARTEWIRSRGTSYRKMEDMGIMLPVSDLQIKYFKGVKYDTVVYVHLEIVELSRIRMKFTYKFYGESAGIKFAEGATSHVFTDKAGKPSRISKELFDKIRGGK
jgi:acyl-CoA thioester hydrolase